MDQTSTESLQSLPALELVLPAVASRVFVLFRKDLPTVDRQSRLRLAVLELERGQARACGILWRCVQSLIRQQPRRDAELRHFGCGRRRDRGQRRAQ